MQLLSLHQSSIPSKTFSSHQQFSNSHTQSSSDYALVEPDGTGAAAPTPGEKHLDQYKTVESLKIVLKENKRERSLHVLKASFDVASCYGCSAPFADLSSEIDSLY